MKYLNFLKTLTALACVVGLNYGLLANANAQEAAPAPVVPMAPGQAEPVESAKFAEKAAELLLAFIPPEVAKSINGTLVTGAEIKEAIMPMLQQALAAGVQVTREQLEPVCYKAAEEMAENKLLVQLAEKAGKKKNVAAAKEKLAEIEKQMAQQRPGAFEAQLKQMGKTREQVAEMFAEQEMIGEVIKEELAKAPAPKAVTEQDVEKFYNENQDKFVEPEMFSAAHILVQFASQKPTEEEKKQALAKIKEIQAQLKADGSNFAELAKAHSACPSKEQGGDLGKFQRGQMVKEFEEAVLKLQAGEISGPVETVFGYHLIKFNGSTPEKKVPLAEAKENIQRFLEQQNKRQADGEFMMKFINELKTLNNLEILLPKPAEPAAPEVKK